MGKLIYTASFYKTRVSVYDIEGHFQVCWTQIAETTSPQKSIGMFETESHAREIALKFLINQNGGMA